MADIGAGVATTLRGNSHHAHLTSDLEAVKHATRPLVSRYADPTHGTGLFHLVETTYKHRGTVQIRSGAGTVRYRTERKQGWGFHVPSLPGVQIALTLPSKATSSSPLQVQHLQ